ncbi:AI-2E family transporter [Cryobacterium sp. BB736]|uniref:AI-2E family transporter n=1 Tax=Cryobacterium sp. BB736 TaxID=2746963 RepID=UPI00187715D4|nr:AI-2E family transporter [Cryobacterium sp. BB736]
MAEPRRRATLTELLTDNLGRVALRCLQVIVILTLAAVVVFALIELKLVVLPVLIALILASAFNPLIGWLRRRNVPRMLATWITLIASLAVLGGAIYLIVIAVRNQWDDLVTSAREGIEQLQDWLRNGPLPIEQEQLDSVYEAGVDFVTSSEFGAGALAGVSAVGEVIAGIVLTIVILFFFLKDGDRMWNFLLTPFSPEHRERGHRVGRTTVRTLGGYMRGTSIVALVDAVAIGIGLAILGVPLALPLAAIVFALAFIPLIGATVAGILAALVALVANGPVVALIVVIIVIAVNQLEGDLLQPVVMAQSLKLHPLVILLALAAGTILGGVIGALISVPIAAVGWNIIKVWNAPEQPMVFKRPAFRRRRKARQVEPITSPDAEV